MSIPSICVPIRIIIFIITIIFMTISFRLCTFVTRFEFQHQYLFFIFAATERERAWAFNGILNKYELHRHSLKLCRAQLKSSLYDVFNCCRWLFFMFVRFLHLTLRPIHWPLANFSIVEHTNLLWLSAHTNYTCVAITNAECLTFVLFSVASAVWRQDSSTIQ